MAVRNIKNLKGKGWHWIPPDKTAIWKMTVTRSDGTLDDITDLVVKAEIVDGVTEGIGRFEFQIWDPNEEYKAAWNGMEVFRYYSDYSTTATTLRFRGRIEKPSHRGNKLKVTGRSETLFYMDITATREEVDIDTGQLLIDLVDTLITDKGFTSDNVQLSGVTITVNWYNKPFWECVQELCEAANFDAYVAADLDWHYFPVGSVKNNFDAIVWDHNLFNMGDFADDVTFVKNKIIVYGAIKEGIQILYTANDTASQAEYGEREFVINDENITSFAQAKDRGIYELARRKDPPVVGDIQTMLLATLQPGESIGISSPPDNISPGFRKIITHRHQFSSNNIPFTTVTIEKTPRQLSQTLRKRIKKQDQKDSTFINVHALQFAYNFFYDVVSGSLSNVEISNGILKPLDVAGDKVWTSLTRKLDSNLVSVQLRVIGTLTTEATYEVSADGQNWLSLTINELTLISNTGTDLRIRVTFNDTNARIDSLSLLYT